MFSTKTDALNWINSFGKSLEITTARIGKYWWLYDKEGYILTLGEIDEIENASQNT